MCAFTCACLARRKFEFASDPVRQHSWTPIRKPSQSQKLIKALRAVFAWATEAEESDNNPTIGVKAIKFRSEGHHAWTLNEVEQFERRHSIGTKARLAMGLLLYTSWRREDAVRLGTQHIVQVRKPDGSAERRIRYRQAKNEHRNPVDMDV